MADAGGQHPPGLPILQLCFDRVPDAFFVAVDLAKRFQSESRNRRISSRAVSSLAGALAVVSRIHYLPAGVAGVEGVLPETPLSLSRIVG